MALNIDILEREDGKYALKLEGRLDTNTAPELEEQLKPVLEKAKVIMFDLAGLEYVSSMGLRTFLMAEKVLAEKGARLFLVRTQPQVAKVFETAQVLGDTEVFDSVESADIFLDAIQRKELLKEKDIDIDD